MICPIVPGAVWRPTKGDSKPRKVILYNPDVGGRVKWMWVQPDGRLIRPTYCTGAAWLLWVTETGAEPDQEHAAPPFPADGRAVDFYACQDGQWFQASKGGWLPVAAVLRPLALLAALLLPVAALADAPVPGTEDWAIMREFKDWIVTQHAPNLQWCCDLGDGRPLFEGEIRWIEKPLPGHYQVLYTRRHWPDGTEEWIDVPSSAVLKSTNPIGLPIAWIIHGHVFCLSITGAV